MSLAAAADEIVANRVVRKTARNYVGKLNTIKIFFASSNIPGVLNESNEIVVPLSREVIVDMFGWLSNNTDLPKRNRRNLQSLNSDSILSGNFDNGTDSLQTSSNVTISVSCMQGYKSALIWYYREKQVVLETEINE
jgi:hypothetical protein